MLYGSFIGNKVGDKIGNKKKPMSQTSVNHNNNFYKNNGLLNITF